MLALETCIVATNAESNKIVFISHSLVKVLSSILSKESAKMREASEDDF
jgi:hypothetical protein